MSVNLLIEHHLEFLSLNGGCTGSFESTLVKMPHCWKSHVMAHMCLEFKIIASLLSKIQFALKGNRNAIRLKYVGNVLYII